MVLLRTFGGLSLETDAGPLSGPAAQRRRLALLTLLAASPSGALTRDKVAGLLWPESDQESARGLLVDAVYALRKALGKDAVVSIGDEVRLNRELVRSDLFEFRSALTRGDYAAAVAVYAAPFLDGVFVPGASEFEAWAELERNVLAREYNAALEQVATQHDELGNHAAAADSWRRLTVLDPGNSRLALRLMQSLARSGDRPGALQHASQHSAFVREEYGVDTDPEIETLASRLRATPGVSLSNSFEVVPVTLAKDAAAAAVTLPGSAEARHPIVEIRRGRPPRTWIMAGSVLAVAAILLALQLPADRFLPGRGRAIRSLAVLPLENLSGDSTRDFVSDGFTDALTTELSHLPELRVISRHSVMRYKEARKPLAEIARELKVDAVLEGSIVRDGDSVRINAQLIDGRTDAHVWAGHYETELGNLVGLGDVARALAQEIGVGMMPKSDAPAPRARIDSRAHEALLKGVYLFGEGDLGGSTRAFERAIELDPTYAAPYAELARNYYFFGLFGAPPQEAFEKMRSAAGRALELDSKLSVAHGALALYDLHFTFNFARAEQHFRRALELNPNSADTRHNYAHFLLALGRSAESAAESRRALELAPFDPTLVGCVGWHHIFDGQYARAVQQSLDGLRLDPENFWTLMVLGWAYEQQSRFEEAIGQFQSAVRLTGGHPFALASLGHAYAVAGKSAEARKVLRELDLRARTKYVSPLDVALVYVGLGDKPQAMAWLQRAYAERSGFVVHIGWDPRFAGLRKEPGFVRLLSDIGVNAASR